MKIMWTVLLHHIWLNSENKWKPSSPVQIGKQPTLYGSICCWWECSILRRAEAATKLKASSSVSAGKFPTKSCPPDNSKGTRLKKQNHGNAQKHQKTLVKQDQKQLGKLFTHSSDASHSPSPVDLKQQHQLVIHPGQWRHFCIKPGNWCWHQRHVFHEVLCGGQSFMCSSCLHISMC